ncbi:MAG: helix-hairpin-helix domain-containing protein [Candidatus Kryptonium sp.]
MIGLTKSESVVFWFLIVAFVAGVAIRLVKGDVVKKETTKFDYSAFDKEFERRSAEIEKYVSAGNKNTDNKFADENFVSAPFKVNINTATKEELMKLPGIGEKTAEQIIKHREIYGKFGKIEDIMNVKGIGQKKFERIKNYLTTN